MDSANRWRDRLREAVDRSWMKRSAIAREAGTAPETLSRILTGRSPNPGFDLVVRITHAAGESVGWVLGERGYCLSAEQVTRAREVAKVLRKVVGDDE